MVKKPEDHTTIILGAGASHDLWMPTGPELGRRIAHLFDPRPNNTMFLAHERMNQVIQILDQTQQGKVHQRHYNASLHIREGVEMASSIDSFIDQRSTNDLGPEIAAMGKVAIAHEILAAERFTPLFAPGAPDAAKQKLTAAENHVPRAQRKTSEPRPVWHFPFYKQLTHPCQPETLEQRLNQVSFIVFNYDRCLEQFLRLALARHWGLSMTDAGQIVRDMNIYHVYGKVGALRGMGENGEQEADYGADLDAEQLIATAKGIKTFSDGMEHDTSVREQCHEAIRRATRVAFLGFSFQPINMQFLRGAGDKPSHGRPTIATGLGIPNPRIAEATKAIARSIPQCNPTVLEDTNCRELVEQYKLLPDFDGSAASSSA